MIHPATELRPVTAEIGLGVFATQRIPKGTIVWVLDELDQRLSPARVRGLGARYARILDHYGYVNAAGERIVCWDLARWVNHSCEANALSCGWNFDVAIRDVEAGEELTNDYGALNLERSFACACHSRSCRRRIDPSDFELLAERWDASVREAFAVLRQVPQPLWGFVPRPRLVAAAARNPAKVPSILQHRYFEPVAVASRRATAPRV